eukprot:15545323-Heterocapsa_arctica.AAC.1
MGVLFEASKVEQSRMSPHIVSDVASSVNSSITKLVRLLESDVTNVSGEWFVMHSTRAGGAAFFDEQYR